MIHTRLGQIGVGVDAYGVFLPKGQAPPRDNVRFTRLAQFGIGVAKYGIFLPKGEAEPPEPEPIPPSGGGFLRPRPFAVIDAILETGQGRQTVDGRLDVGLLARGATGQGTQTVDAVAILTADAVLEARQTKQDARVITGQRMKAVVQSRQQGSAGEGAGRIDMAIRIKSGVLPQERPSYDGDPLPDIFLKQ